MRYVVTIRVKRGNISKGLQVDSLYYNNPPKSDYIDFRSSLIRITCNRSRSFDKDSLLTNNSNTIFKQILKVMLYYGAVNRNGAFIHSLQICKGVDNTEICKIEYKQSSQPVAWNNVSLTYTFNHKELANQLFSSGCGEKLANILSHWLVGIYSKDRFKRFESLWRAFEQLCDHHNRTMVTRKEFDNLREMRNFIDNHDVLFPLTSSLLAPKDYVWLRRFQWKQLIYNNFPLSATKQGVWDNYRDNFVCLNTDNRIIKLLNDTLVYRAKILTEKGVKAAIDAHLARCAVQLETKNLQLAAFMCCKFAYYIRNKMFHGEVYEKNFRFYSTADDDWQLDELNTILETLTFELINNFISL